MAREADPVFASTHNRSIVSLNSMTETYTQKSLNKGDVRMSNWAAIPLTDAQRTCEWYRTHFSCDFQCFWIVTDAANDAHVALTVYKRLLAVAAQNKLALDSTKFTSRVTQETTLQTSVPLAVAPSTSTGSTSSSVPPSETSTSTASTTSTNASRPTWARPLVYATTVQYYNPGPRPQELRAYKLWHNEKMALGDICAALRSKEHPLAESTVM